MKGSAPQLTDIVTLQKGKAPLLIPYEGLDAEPYLSPEFLRGRGQPDFAKPSTGLIRVEDGDVLILWDGSNAGEILRAVDGLLASTMMRVDHGGRFDDAYFFYALKNWEGYLKGQTSGSGIPHVDKELLGRLEIFEPSRGAQECIAKVLSTIDKAIAQTEALIAKQQRIKTALMQDLLTRGIDEHGNLRSEDTHAFKDSALGRIPVEWDQVFLGDLYGENPKNGIYKKSQDIGEGVLMIGQNSVTKDRRINFALCRRAFVYPNELKLFGLRDGDVLVSRVYATVRGVGMPIYIVNLSEQAVYESNMVRLRFDQERAEPEYLFLTLLSHSTRMHIEASVNASNQVSLNQRCLRLIPIALPPLTEQHCILSRLKLAESATIHLRSCAGKLRRQKTALMQDLLSGKVSVTPLLEAEAGAV